MADLGMPTLTITIKKAAEAVVTRLKNGVAAVIVRDAGVTAGLYVLGAEEDLPTGLGAETEAYVKRAFLGGENRPQKVLLVVIGEEDDLVVNGCAALATSDFDYLAAPADVDEEEKTALVTWLDGVREKYCIGKAVLPDHAADNMAVVNFSASGIVVGKETFTGADYCSRIAGLLAGTEISNSSTSYPLEEVTAVDEIADHDAAVAEGKLILVHDGRKVRLGRAVNSLTTVPPDQSEALKKIKIVEAVDLIRQQSKMLIDDQFRGKGNSYDTKLLIVSVLYDFLVNLELQGVVSEGTSSVDLNLTKQRAWLKEQGVDVTGMTDDEIRKADTGSWIFLEMGGTILDGMEDFDLVYYMGGNV